DLAAHRQHLAMLLLDLLDQRSEIKRVLGVEMRSARSVEAEDVVPGVGGDLCGGARRQLEMRDVVDGHGNAVLLTPVLGEAVDPPVVFGDEVAPLKDLQGLGRSKGGRHERRRECRRQAGRPGNGARRLQEVPSRDGSLLVSSVSHRTTPVCYGDDDVADALSMTALDNWFRGAPPA